MGSRRNTGLAYTLAWHYLKSNRKGGSIAFMMRLCFAGLLIGTFALMLTLIIMSGFERVISEKMQSINADAIAYSPGKQIDYKDMKDGLLASHGESIRAISGHSTRQIILSGKESQSIIMLRAVDPKSEELTSSIGTKVLNPAPLPKLLSKNQIILGHKIANTHDILVGDTITMLIPEASRKNRISLEEHEVTVAGLFKVGLEEYDSNMAYCSLPLLYELFEDESGVDQLAISLKDGANLTQLKTDMPGLEIKSWMDLYPALVASLKLEKYVMFCLLALITLVASMNMISLLFMQVQTKRGDIAILKAMGMPSTEIKKIFVSLGLGLAVSASLCGLVLAFLAGILLQTFPIIRLPDVYYVSHLPAHMDIWQFLFVFSLTILISLFATWVPSSLAQRVNITSVLRQE